MNPANSARTVPRNWTRTRVAVDGLGEGGPTRVGTLAGDGETAGAVGRSVVVGDVPPHAATRPASSSATLRRPITDDRRGRRRALCPYVGGRPKGPASVVARRRMCGSVATLLELDRRLRP